MNIIYPNYKINQTEIKTDKKLLVIHSTACTAKTCISWFRSKRNKRSSAHDLITINGDIYNFINHDFISWHAGVSQYKDYPTSLHGKEWFSVNPCSIGIELEGPPEEIGLDGWPDNQINALIEYCVKIKERFPGIKLTDHHRIAAYGIKKNGKIIGYKKDTTGNIIRGRKGDVTRATDDINKFPWKRLLKMTGIEEA